MATQIEKRMMTAACRYAYSRFTLNYYLLYDGLDEAPERSERQEGFLDQFFALVRRFLKGEYPVDELDSLRRQVIHEMEVISAYVDFFQIYEQVLRGMELKFSGKPIPDIDDEQAVNKLMRYIVSADDTVEMNQRIRFILGQLPVRFTKAKFFSILSHALSVYEGTGKESLELLLDSLRLEALLAFPENMPDGHEELEDLLEIMRQGNFKSPSPEEFKRLMDGLDRAQEILPNESANCIDMIDLVNDFYVMCLTRRDALIGQREEDMFCAVFAKVLEQMDDWQEGREEELEGLLIQMEGLQERYYEQWEKYELADLEQDMGIGKDTEEYQVLWKVWRLLSTSSFMSLEPEKPGETGILLSKNAVEEMCGQLAGELEESWKTMPKRLVRGIMARLLGSLPMFFRHSDEIREFIAGSLSSCTDLAEKAACIAMIDAMMEDEDALV